MNNLSISTTFLPDGKSLYDALRICDSLDLQSVEIGSNHCFERNYDYINDFSFNYLLHNYFPIPESSFVLNIASFDKGIRDRSLRHIIKAIDFCDYIGGHLYTFHPGFLTDPKGSNKSNKNYDFQWDKNQIDNKNFIKVKELMYRTLDKVIHYAQSKNVTIAIETEGSLNKKEHLLMQRPEEYIDFMSNYENSDIGINLNIGHLNLAANAFEFKREDFVELISDYMVAMELSHNNGYEDQHLPLCAEKWYWTIINDIRFKHTYKIMEFRNTKISDIVKCIELFNKEYHALQIS
jgi:sugar phosphate isomerase/epimerase|tara:strand:- start:7694 stop:8572 length:879 start_codon:yes stop_codon:yes gene_type:complete